MTVNDIRYVILEEFVPVEHVTDMLVAADNLFQLLPTQHMEVAENLRRSMVWMVKYIAPTSEFWDWQTFEEPFDNQTHLRVKFIGLGWLIALTRRFYSTDQVSPISVERDLSQILSKITGHVPVHAVARLKSTPWSVDNLKVLAKALRSTYPEMKINGKTKMLTAPDIQVLFEAQERVRLSRISSELDGQVHQILGNIKRWANSNNKYEGADWCAYKRRRLTTVVKRVPPSRLDPDQSDIALTNEPTGLYERKHPNCFDHIEKNGSSGSGSVGTIMFPIYPYHTGVINPRTVIRVTGGIAQADLSELLHYVSYLWVNHYTRLWCYLDFEDQFAYASDIRHLKELNEPMLAGYTGRALHLEELRSIIEMQNRIADGKISAYKPPRAKFIFTGTAEGVSVIESLRRTLIPSTITQLQIDPLVGAPDILRHASVELNQAYGTFSQAASLRMQRLLQILQTVFILAAAATVLALVPIGNNINSAVIAGVAHDGWYRRLYKTKESISWLKPFHISLYAVQLLTLMIVFIGAVSVVRSKTVSRTLKRFLE
jgi:hypothetical protein